MLISSCRSSPSSGRRRGTDLHNRRRNEYFQEDHFHFWRRSICGGLYGLAQSPELNISKRHGNLRDAQSLIVQAYQKIDTAPVPLDHREGG